MDNARIIIDMDSDDYKAGHKCGAMEVSRALKNRMKLDNLTFTEEFIPPEKRDNTNYRYGAKDGFAEAIVKWRKIKERRLNAMLRPKKTLADASEVKEFYMRRRYANISGRTK
jgi:hypothetical protein